MKARKSLVALGLWLALCGVASAKTWKVNLKDAEISALVSEVAEITGKNFIVDPRVKGNITVISSKPLSADQVYDLFLGVLSVNGFAAVPSGNAIKLVPDVNAKQNAVPFDMRQKLKGEALVTRIIMLENTSANELVPVLRPLLPQFAHLAAINGANALVISDHANNIAEIEELVRSLDTGEGDELEVIALKEVRADDVMSMLDTLTSTSASKDMRGSRLRVLADNRGNRLLVKGDARARKRIREIVAQLDKPAAERLSGVRVFRLKHASAKQTADVLKNLATGDSSSRSSTPTGGAATQASSASTASGGVSIIADEAQNALVVRADPSLMRELEQVILQLDQRRSQVLIQAAIVEVSGENADQLGVQWAFGDPSKGVGLINFSNAGTSIASVAAAAAKNDPTLAGSPAGALIGIGKSETNSNGDRTFYGALIQALNTISNANLLSTPSIMTLDNQEAKIVVGQNVPFITGSTTSGTGGTSNPFTTIERQDVGITLKVVPHIGEGGAVRLEVEQEVSSVVPSVSGVNSADLITNKRSIKTTILADDGQTIVLGGLIQDDSKLSVSEVPLLGKVPVLGYLFRSKSNSKTKRNLLVFLQPQILRDSESALAISTGKYNLTRGLQLQVGARGELMHLPESINQVYQGSAPAKP
ncbi:type II secretion system protein D (GspD) [Fluviicoccus keumensis]|uniref:Type II secretion system protein D (GspD) n=1 Tax=Fluviicoccus keumensis TaxID=1435465 RepID=A0A4Q7YKC0_9GAMM|nr:type II secretion system secretin GspD [Fluviicoccus keumensis]RZU36945.1 type II secretion system protein D (GspD) [Fluviicoccus keumensis]